MKKNKGLTLLELVLALTIILIIVSAISVLSSSAARLTTNLGEGIRLQNELEYVLRDIELNIKSGKNPTVTSNPCPVSNPCLLTVTVTDANGNSSNYTYTYNPVSKTISRTIANGVPQVLSVGVLIPKAGQSVFFTPASSGNKLVEINLAAQKTAANGETISVPGITKSILLKGF